MEEEFLGGGAGGGGEFDKVDAGGECADIDVERRVLNVENIYLTSRKVTDRKLFA